MEKNNQAQQNHPRFLLRWIGLHKFFFPWTYPLIYWIQDTCAQRAWGELWQQGCFLAAMLGVILCPEIGLAPEYWFQRFKVELNFDQSATADFDIKIYQQWLFTIPYPLTIHTSRSNHILNMYVSLTETLDQCQNNIDMLSWYEHIPHLMVDR